MLSSQEKLAFAETLRNNPTRSEKKLYDEMLGRGWSFKFQELLYGYIPDFYFPEQKRIVELDGKRFHDREKDRIRDKNFKTRGIKTLRVKSGRVFTEFEYVLEEIENFIFKTPITPRKKRRSKRPATCKAKIDTLFEEFLFVTEGL